CAGRWMAASKYTPEFTLEPTASSADVRQLFHRIGDYCREQTATRVIVRVLDNPGISREQFVAGVVALADAGCRDGFKVAWISSEREMFTRTGIGPRVFYDRMNA